MEDSSGTLSPLSDSDTTLIEMVNRGVQTNSNELTEPKTARAAASQPLRRHDARPHTVAALCIALGIVWCASTIKKDPFGFSNPTRGFFAAVSLFLVFATLQFPDGTLVRPHPALWRFVKGVSTLYLSLICFLLFQDVTTVREWLHQIDPALGVPLKEKDYATDCRIFTFDDSHSIFANIKSKLDVFFIAHFGGWLVKALVIRDQRLLWAMSLLFEWMEITFRYILPNFWECWWDHLLLDVFGCNWLGIWLGMRFVKWFEMKDYNWRWSHDACSMSPMFQPSIKEQSLSAKLPPPLELSPRNDASQQTLLSFGFLEDCVSVAICFIFLRSISRASLLRLRAQLWLEPSHWILILRTVFFTFAAAAGTRDLYEFVTKPCGRRLGIQGWLGVAIILSELMLAVKFWHALPPSNPMPLWIKVIWIVFFTLTLVVGFWLFFHPSQPSTKSSSKSQRWRKVASSSELRLIESPHCSPYDQFTTIRKRKSHNSGLGNELTRS